MIHILSHQSEQMQTQAHTKKHSIPVLMSE